MTNRTPDEMDYEEWCTWINRLITTHERNLWDIGDAWNTRPDHYATAAQRQQEFGMSHKSLRTLGWVSRCFELSTRVDNLTHRHHRILSSLLAPRFHGKYRETVRDFIAKATARTPRWSVKELSTEVKRFKFENDIVKPKANLRLTYKVKRPEKEPVKTTVADMLSKTSDRMNKILDKYQKEIDECISTYEIGLESRDQLFTQRIKWTSLSLRSFAKRLTELADKFSLYTGKDIEGEHSQSTLIEHDDNGTT